MTFQDLLITASLPAQTVPGQAAVAAIGAGAGMLLGRLAPRLAINMIDQDPVPLWAGAECLDCGQDQGFTGWIPLLPLRCPHCDGGPAAGRHVLEALSAAALVAAARGDTLAFYPQALALLVLMACVGTDIAARYVPDRIVLPAIGACLLIPVFSLSAIDITLSVLGMAGAAATILAIGFAIRQAKGSLGIADVKFAAALGALFGPLSVPFMGCGLLAAVSFARRTRLPATPVLMAGALIGRLAGLY